MPMTPELLFAISVVCSGVIGMAVAQQKRASLRQGFAWGFVLGPIGWIIAAIILKPEAPEAQPPATPFKQSQDQERLARAVKFKLDQARAAEQSESRLDLK